MTGTCNVLAAAVLAEGTTTIDGGACEPEVVDLGNLLFAMGARISGLGTPTLTIDGVERLEGVAHTVIPDRIEAATLLIAAAITRGKATLTNIRPDHMTAVLETLREIGVCLEVKDRSVEVSAESCHCGRSIASPFPIRGFRPTFRPN